MTANGCKAHGCYTFGMVFDVGDRWMMRTRAPVSAAVALCVLTLIGCGNSSQDCFDAVDSLDHTAAQARCERAWEHNADPAVAVAAARSANRAGDLDRATHWADRVRGTVYAGDIAREMGLVAWRAGEPERAFDLFEQAAQIYAPLDDARLGQALYNLHYLAWSKSDHQPALDFAQRALVAAMRAGERRVQTNALVGMASVYEETGLLAAANAVLDQAASVVEPAHLSGQFNIANSRGLVAMQAGRHGIALGHFRTADALFDEVSDTLRLRVVLNLTSTYLSLGRAAEAADALARASALVGNRDPSYAVLFYRGRVALSDGRFDAADAAFEQALSKDRLPGLWRWEITYWRAMTARQRGDQAAAERYLVTAIEELEAIGGELRLADLTAHFLTSRRKPYEALFELQVANDRLDDALRTVERAKSSVVGEALVTAANARASDMPVDPLAESVDLSARLGLAAMRAGQRQSPHKLEDVVAALAEREALIYFSTGAQVWPIKLTQSGVQVAAQPVAVDALNALIDGTLQPDADAAAFARLADALLPESLRPLRARDLIILTDPLVRRVGFAALQVDGEALVQRHVISYLPNLSALLRPQTASSNGDTMVVLADPTGDLPAARREGQRVAAITGSEALLGDEATVAALQSAQRASRLHLATHVGHDSSGPWLALADGRVSVWDVMDARLMPDLVVLASCASAQTLVQGYFGSMAGGFYAAGARQVLGTLWSVEDAQTEQLIDWFYAEPGREAALDLAAVQRRAIREGQPVRAWAGLIILGVPGSAGAGG